MAADAKANIAHLSAVATLQWEVAQYLAETFAVALAWQYPV